MDHLSRSTGRADPQRDALIEASWNVWIVGRDERTNTRRGMAMIRSGRPMASSVDRFRTRPKVAQM